MRCAFSPRCACALDIHAQLTPVGDGAGRGGAGRRGGRVCVVDGEVYATPQSRWDVMRKLVRETLNVCCFFLFLYVTFNEKNDL